MHRGGARASASSTAPSRTPARRPGRRRTGRPEFGRTKSQVTCWQLCGRRVNMAVHLRVARNCHDTGSERRRSHAGRDRAGVRRPRRQADRARRRARQRLPRGVDRADEAHRHLRAGGARGVRRHTGVDALLRAGHPGTGARLDEPGRRDGRAHRRRQAAGPVRHRRAEAALPARDGHRRTARHDGAHRTRRRFGPAGDDHHRPRRRRRSGDQRRQDLDLQRAALRADRAAVQDRSRRHAQTPRHLDRAGRTRRRADGVARSAQARLQGRRVLRTVLRRLPRPGHGHPRRRPRQGFRGR